MMKDVYIHREENRKNREGGREREKGRGEKRGKDRDQNEMEIDSENQACCVNLKRKSVSRRGQNELFSIEVSKGVSWLGMWRLWAAGEVRHATILTPRKGS